MILAWITFRLSVFYLVQPVACQPDISFQSRIGDVVDSMCMIVSANTPMYFAWLATLPFENHPAARKVENRREVPKRPTAQEPIVWNVLLDL